MQSSDLKIKLDRIYKRYHSPEYLKSDPLLCVHRFKRPSQIEVVGFLASSLSYGRVDRIIYSIDKILSVAGNDLFSFINKTTFHNKKKLLSEFKHRFNDGNDVALFLETLKHVLNDYGTIGNLFQKTLENNNFKMKTALIEFIATVRNYQNKIIKKQIKSFNYLLPSPLSGSACKRLNMYMRWMIRKRDGIDFGIWKNIPASILIIPVDVHIAKISKQIDLTSRKIPDWKMAEEITGKLKKIAPDDPVKYDFSLCRYGMHN